jgi:redox-sensitive bicupin YhaK (pirin superfamily)
MTAGSGLLHIETPPEWLVASGGLFHGLQLWVNLPRDSKMTAPRYQDIRSSQVGLATSADAGALVRVIAGQVGAVAGPGSTYTPMTMVHASINAGARLDMPWDPAYNALVYVLSGQGSVGLESGGAGVPLKAGNLAVLGAGDFVTVTAAKNHDSRTPDLDVIVIGGQPIREPIAWAGPFVMNTKAEVMQAYEDFSKGRLGTIPAVHGAPTTLQEG